MMKTLEEEEERSIGEETNLLQENSSPKPVIIPSTSDTSKDTLSKPPGIIRSASDANKDEFRKPSILLKPNNDEEPSRLQPQIQRILQEHTPSDGRRGSLFTRSSSQETDSSEGKGKEPVVKPTKPGQRLLQETKFDERKGSMDSIHKHFDKHDKHDRKTEIPRIVEPGSQRRPSTFETIFQALRRPSAATLEVFNNLRRGSGVGSRSGSHATIDSRRPSHADAGSHSTVKSENLSVIQKLPSRSAMSQNHVTFRRPSGVITFNPDQMNIHQKRYIMGLLQGSNSSLPDISKDLNPPKKKEKPKPCNDGNDAYISALSALYAKVLFVLGIAFPVTEVLSSRVSTHYYQGYYLFLYLGSIGFMTFMYMTLLKDKAVFKILKNSFEDVEEDEFQRFRNFKRSKSFVSSIPIRYGSFYLRLGAVAFGIGSMVYSGLEFGQYFEQSDCNNVLQAITPVTRMVLTLVQMQFIFLSSKQMEEHWSKYRGVAKFGVMHMVATNLCEWLYVIVEETKHEIIHLKHLKELYPFDEGHGNETDHDKDHHDLHKRGSDLHDIYECRRANVMGSLVQDASPFLFPCTIEYSLICAVILYEMWKNIKRPPDFDDEDDDDKREKRRTLQSQTSLSSDIIKSHHHFSVDCSNAHKGLFSGILLLVMVIISLIMFFVMAKDPEYHKTAVYEVHLCELIVYIIMTCMVISGNYQMRFLKFKLSHRVYDGIGLDNTLLMWAQSGVFIYCMFSIIACYHLIDHNDPGGFITELFSLIQTTCQTAFILDATFRRTDSFELQKRKPGRQIITFLLVGNMALWLVNTLQKNRAEFRPTHLNFFGVWGWTIITHVSMPLAIFYRFHSTICLFEIWKDAYKFKQAQHV